ncbi:MAG: hypothetical protein J6X02_02930 [Bacilli bacterium]|nr:hypothetical protein [Bacilli bacterium]
MDEIIKLVLNRNKARKLLSTNDVRRICEIIKGKNNYFDFSIDFKDASNDGMITAGECDSDSIVFYKQGIEKILDDYYQEFITKNYFDGSKIDIYNFFYLSIIFHEFTHVKQRRTVEFGYNSLERKLYNISFRLMNLKDVYDNINYLFPTEVNAYSHGYFDAYNIYHKLPKDFLSKEDRQKFLIYASNALFKNYDVNSQKEIITSPIESFYKVVDEYNVSKVDVDIKKIESIIKDNHDITIYRKITLGLPLNFIEFAYAKLINDGINKGQDIDILKKLQKKL